LDLTYSFLALHIHFNYFAYLSLQLVPTCVQIYGTRNSLNPYILIFRNTCIQLRAILY